ncbi:SDR family oxidoreductase [Nocardia macrotermitis]|uniref:Diacetyl reductase [(S)-acetoin forming] n=1 Tax=Nocardia macrotermitis TaxID=2585198 RepID=A0A7K0DFW8_9NOCA|nr:SDR family oxidoreductase [Nocardia macrotermitis]MQY24202.1 Diacetyl reductase [(S)-acetoin forming] [Nocardia macrotermitis]
MSEVLVVIGAGGMGEAIARRLGAGRQVLLADFDAEVLDRVGTALAADGYLVDLREVDVSQRDSVSSLAGRAAELGSVTAVAHTAGLSPAQASTAAILAVDMVGVALVLEEFGQVVAPGGAGVVIASMAGALVTGRLPAEWEAALATTAPDELLDLPFLAGPELASPGAAYSIAKRANQVRVQVASLAWGRRGARINSISPGVISTAMSRRELAGESGPGMRAMVEASGTGRLGTAGDIAAAAAYLLGPDASFVTGTDVLVDGGAVAASRYAGA